VVEKENMYILLDQSHSLQKSDFLAGVDVRASKANIALKIASVPFFFHVTSTRTKGVKENCCMP